MLLLAAFAIGAPLAALGGWIFWRNAGSLLVKSGNPDPAELVIVLGGDFWGPRVVTGAHLGQRGVVPRVLISGPSYRGRPEGDLAIDFLARRGYPRALFQSYLTEVGSTIEEAISLAPELHRLNVHKAILVTRATHSLRAEIVFRLFCSGIEFQSVSAPEEFPAADWWKHPDAKQRVLEEWKKILGTIFWKYPEYLVKGIVS